MRIQKKNRFQFFEIALLVGMVVSLLWGVWSLQSQDALEGKMIRLHVLANSDTEEDQALKLQVRDRVLDMATELLESTKDMNEARTKIEEELPAIAAVAEDEVRARGYSYHVAARLEDTEFPTKEYDGFALPAGQYLALRVLIGDAAGQNWWCVVYPPLCTTAATDLKETAIMAGMDKEDVSLMTEADPGYELKFRSLELWEDFRQWLEKK